MSLYPPRVALEDVHPIARALAQAARWSYYLRSAELPIRRRDAMTSFLAGMSLGWLPGGGLIAARLAQEHGRVRMRQAAPALLVKLVADLFVVATPAFGFGLASRGNGCSSQSLDWRSPAYWSR